MHSSSQEKMRSQGTHTRFADDSDREDIDSGHGVRDREGIKATSWAGSSIVTGNDSSNGTSATTTSSNNSQSSSQSPQKQFHQHKLSYSTASPRPSPLPTTIAPGTGAVAQASALAPVAKAPSLFRKMPPPQPKNIDAENHQSMLRRQGRPLYNTTTTSPTKAPSVSPTLHRTQHQTSFKNSPQRMQGYFTPPPKSPVRPLSFGSQSLPTSTVVTSPRTPRTPKTPVLGTVISVPVLNSTSWGDERSNGDGKSKDDDWGGDDRRKETMDKDSQAMVPGLTRQTGGGGGFLSMDGGTKKLAATMTTANHPILSPVRTKQLDIPSRSNIEHVGVKESKVPGSTVGKQAEKDDDVDEDEFDNIYESLKDADWVEICKQADEGQGRNRERELPMEREHRLLERDRGSGLHGGGESNRGSGLKTPTKDVKSAQDARGPTKELANAVGEERDLPYSDTDPSDGERREWKQRHEKRISQMQEFMDATSVQKNEDEGNTKKDVVVKGDVVATNSSKDMVTKYRDSVHDLDRQWDQEQTRDRGREREQNLMNGRSQDAQSKEETILDKSIPGKSRQHEAKNSIGFNPSPPPIKSSSDEEPSRSQLRQRPTGVSRTNRTSLSERSLQEAWRREVKESKCEPGEVSEIESSSEDDRLPRQRRPKPSRPSQKARESPKEPTCSLPLDEESDRPPTSSQPIYKAKHANLHRSADDQDSDLELEDDIFSATPILSQPSPSHASSACGSQTLSKTSSAGMSISSTKVNVDGSKYVSLSDSSDLEDFDLNDPFRDHSKLKSQSKTNKNEDEFILKKREDSTQDFVDKSSRQDQEQRDRSRQYERIHKEKLVSGGDGSRGSRSNMSDRMVENNSENYDIKSNGDTQGSGTSRARSVRQVQIEDEEEEEDFEKNKNVRLRYPNTKFGGSSSAVPRKDRSTSASKLKEISRTSVVPKTRERDVQISHGDDRDQRRDRGLDQTDRSRKQRLEQSGRDVVKEEQLTPSPYDVLLTPTSAAKIQLAEKNRSSQKRRARPNSTSDEDTDSPASRPTTPEPATCMWTTPKGADEPPSTPTRKIELDAVRRQQLRSPRKSPRIADDFKLPSPRRRRIRNIAEMMSLSDDDSLSQDSTAKEEETLCPYCQDVLPKDMSLRLRSSLAKILRAQEERRTAQLEFLRRRQIRDEHLDNALVAVTASSGTSTTVAISGTAIPRKPGVPRPKRLERLQKQIDLAASENEAAVSETDAELEKKLFSKVSAVDKFEFCRIHVAETKIIPAGLSQKYPFDIKFEELPIRIQRMEPELLGIIHGTVASPYLDRALDNYRKMGNGARNPQVVLAGVQMTLPGYYGSKGTKMITEILVKLFLDSNILTHEATRPQEPIEYIQQVLIPETGVRLILEDRNKTDAGEGHRGISMEQAQAIMLDSVEFGNYVHDAELPS